jgi:hypothetical protein
MNWGVMIGTQNLSVSGTTGHQFFVIIGYSSLPSAVDTYFHGTSYYINNIKRDGYIRFAVVMTTGAIKIYCGSVANVANNTGAFSGTMGGTEILMQNAPCEWSKYNGILSDSVLTDFFDNDTLPANPIISIQGGHEINPAAPVFYDTSGNATALDLSDVDVQYWPEASASGDSSDTGFTSPLVEVPITIAADCTAGVKSISLRRTRVGIPVRTPALPDAVVYDDGILPVTVTNPGTWIKAGPAQDYQVYLP